VVVKMSTPSRRNRSQTGLGRDSSSWCIGLSKSDGAFEG
jgi:hypothetical protein